MELGNQIKALRVQRGVTQEALAQHLNVSPQAVSKWEREAALPDVQLLPAISAYFGVTIDALFALSDDTRMERIQNMLWDERVLDPAVVEGDREGAMAVWEQMCRDWPEDWMVWYTMGDAMVRTGRYGKAKKNYRRAFDLQPAPKYVDSLESIAQVCELDGDIPGAVAALEEETAVLAEQWDTRTGETADKVRREIARLKTL